MRSPLEASQPPRLTTVVSRHPRSEHVTHIPPPNTHTHTHRRLQFTILAYDAASGEIKTRSNGSLKECVGKLVDNEHILAADPLSRMIGTCVCGGVVYVT